MNMYAIEEPDTHMVKIGISKHAKKRLPQLQTGNPSKLAIRQTFLLPDDTQKAREIEAKVHETFEPHRKVGEWFDGVDAPTLKAVHRYWYESITGRSLRTNRRLTFDIKPSPVEALAFALACKI